MSNALDPFDPTKITARQSYSAQKVRWGDTVTLTVTLENANTASFSEPDTDVSTAPTLSYTDPDGAAQTVTPDPATVTVAGESVDHRARTLRAVVKVPAFLTPAPLPEGAAIADDGDGTRTLTLSLPDCEGGQGASFAVALVADRAQGAPARPAPAQPAPAQPPLAV